MIQLSNTVASFLIYDIEVSNYFCILNVKWLYFWIKKEVKTREFSHNLKYLKKTIKNNHVKGR